MKCPSGGYFPFSNSQLRVFCREKRRKRQGRREEGWQKERDEIKRERCGQHQFGVLPILE